MANRYLVLYAFPRGGEEPPRVGLSVGRKVGGAVERNQLKRLLREACSRQTQMLPAGHDIVIVARAAGSRTRGDRGPGRGRRGARRARREGAGGNVKRVVREVAVAPIRLYQTVISPALGPRCRYAPSCSDYALDAIREFGIIRGAILAGWRLLRCNPFSHGGLDPVSAQRLFRSAGPRSARG